eukprot:1957564-Rhodomonas_salina.1
MPITTVNPNIRFDFAVAEPASQAWDDEAGGPAARTSASSQWGWRAFVCSVGVDRHTESHWLVEVLKLLACVSAHL